MLGKLSSGDRLAQRTIPRRRSRLQRASQITTKSHKGLPSLAKPY